MKLLERCKDIFTELSAEGSNTLKLIGLRTPYMHNSWFANFERLLVGRQAINPLYMCEADAAARGLHDGDVVRLQNGNGDVVTQLEISDDLRPGAVAMCHGYGHARAGALRTAAAKPGVNYNRLAPTGPDAYERLSHMSWLSALPVTVERCV